MRHTIATILTALALSACANPPIPTPGGFMAQPTTRAHDVFTGCQAAARPFQSPTREAVYIDCMVLGGFTPNTETIATRNRIRAEAEAQAASTNTQPE